MLVYVSSGFVPHSTLFSCCALRADVSVSLCDFSSLKYTNSKSNAALRYNRGYLLQSRCDPVPISSMLLGASSAVLSASR